jgi:phosphoribosylpyrophosphate synthetase
LKNKKVIILHSGAPDPNGGLTELELILQILRDNKVKLIEVFFSYFPYGMQDRVFEKGETNVSENLIEKLINFYQVKKIYIIDPHFGGKKWIKKYPIIFASAVPMLIEGAKKDFSQNILFLSPDIGGKRRTGIKGTKKKRINTYTTKMEKVENLKKIVRGRIIGVVDDILETGGTLDGFYGEIRKLKPKKIIALITHGVLKEGILKIKKRYSKLYLTNTINQGGANIDITDLIIDTLKKKY